jgi:hypothetical protein
MDPNEPVEGGKIVLFIASIITGGICGCLINRYLGESIPCAIVYGFFFALINPIVARISVWFSQLLHSVAFPDTHKSWSVAGKVWTGAFWPITLPFWIVVFLFFISINHLFRGE